MYLRSIQRRLFNECLQRCGIARMSSSTPQQTPQPVQNKKRPPNKQGRLRVQRTQWLKKVDEVQEQNKPKKEKDEIKELKRQYNLTEENQYEILNAELIPLHLVDYEKQCKIKSRRLELFVEQFVKKVAVYSSTVILDSNGYPCVLHDLLKSDLVDEYQSQNNFQMNFDVNGKLAVGLIFGDFKEDQRCIRPVKFSVCKRSHRLLSERFETYLTTKSRLRPILDFRSPEGNWTNFFVRSNQAGEHQCLATLDNRNLTVDQLSKECDLIREHFQSNELNVRSFDLEIKSSQKKNESLRPPSSSHTTVQPKLEHVFGEHYLLVKLNELDYHVRVKSLFPVNVEVYGKIIDSMVDNLDLTRAMNLLFVEPQSGLGLPSLAKIVNQLFVVSKSDSQLNDCKKSLAHLPNTKNIQFSSGQALRSVFKILDSNTKELCVVIRQDEMCSQILQELRINKNVSKIALISTRPTEELLKIWIHLCLDGKNSFITGNPFTFISATPCDTHPHSNIYTVVSIFERIIS